ncbi:MAG TPA: hypothetical protein VKZ77_13380 [Bacillaceae bacterium]|nr:hypothetical protein [Paenibacillus bovis]HLU23450.1 hypothetical protein [Bacillaceae bacterium]
MSPETFEQVYKRAKYQLELEGFILTEEDKEVIRKVVMGDMSRQELLEILQNEK